MLFLLISAFVYYTASYNVIIDTFVEVKDEVIWLNCI